MTCVGECAYDISQPAKQKLSEKTYTPEPC